MEFSRNGALQGFRFPVALTCKDHASRAGVVSTPPNGQHTPAERMIPGIKAPDLWFP